MQKQQYPKPIQLKHNRWTYQNPDKTLWTEIYGKKAIFYDAWNFEDGFAVVRLKDGWTFVDVACNLWKQRFEHLRNFREGLACVKPYLKSYTFMDANGNFWKKSFQLVSDFHEGLSGVMMDDGWTFVDKDSNIWKQRYKFVYPFCEGMASVQLKDGFYTFVDKSGYQWDCKFCSSTSFNKGLAIVNREFDVRPKYIDKYQNFWDRHQADIFYDIYDRPEVIFELDSNIVNDKKFFRTALSVIKQKINDMQKDHSEKEVIKYKEILNKDLQLMFSNIIEEIRQDISLYKSLHVLDEDKSKDI